MATFKEICALISRKYVSGPDKRNPDLAHKLRAFWSHFSIFDLEEQSKNLNIKSFFLPLKYTLVATLKEKCALTSRKYVSESGKSIPD